MKHRTRKGHDGGQRETDLSLSKRLSSGPRALVVVTAAIILLCIALIYTRQGSHPSYLFFFFLPVAASAVVLGAWVGLIMAALSVVGTLLPSIWLGLDQVLAGFEGGETTAILGVWAIFLLAMAGVVGWVSERGGSLSLTQGLGGRAIEAIEEERRRTGQDIHDGIAQYAAAAYIEAEVLGEVTAGSSLEVREQVERVKHILSMLVGEARAMAGSLRPPELGPEEFAQNFTKMVDAFTARSGIATELEVEGDFGSLGEAIRICTYRITQEALRNVERHAESTSVQVWARAGRGGADLIVRDNGKGFDPDKVVDDGAYRHFGLSGMRERAGYLGGRFVIRSAPGEGTSVVMHIPSYQGKQNGRL
jgi:signal transduction histidine kinase